MLLIFWRQTRTLHHGSGVVQISRLLVMQAEPSKFTVSLKLECEVGNVTISCMSAWLWGSVVSSMVFYESTFLIHGKYAEQASKLLLKECCRIVTNNDGCVLRISGWAVSSHWKLVVGGVS